MRRAKQINGFGILRSVLEQARLEAGCSLIDLTVLSTQVDPYRLDTPAGHRDGKWLGKHMNKLLGTTKRIHWRGLHYVFVVSKPPVIKPDGTRFRNTDEDWTWLSEIAGKAARWLGYTPFERIIDNRNADPIIHRKTAIVLAGEKSRHSKDGSLLSYLIHVADEYPALYIGLLGRLVPVEAKLKTDFERPQRLTSDMSLNEMVTQFELKIKNEDYQPPPPVIEHNNDGDDDDDESS